MLCRCPKCGRVMRLHAGEDAAYADKPYEYRCPDCGKVHYYKEEPAVKRCEGCGRMEKKPARRRRVWRFVAWACVLAAISGVVLAALPRRSARADAAVECEALYDSHKLWTDFRAKNPYSVHLVGLRAYSDSSFNILISEPPRGVTLADIKDCFSQYDDSVMLYSYPIGYDGSLTDVVVSVKNVENIGQLRSELFKKLYCTDYKADFVALDSMDRFCAYSTGDLDLSVGADDLRRWLAGDSCETFSASDGRGAPQSIADILETECYGLFYSTRPGLVAWVVSAGYNSPDQFYPDARKFGLDTDLILGAIKRRGRIAVIAREREVPLRELPPLRQETIDFLATTIDSHLSQSFERNHLFAGKQLGGKDWAPILLSEGLWHTEYGNLLNVADQMLKSWSENGDIEYTRFSYSKPIYWAFEDRVTKYIGSPELTFNWNTKGAGYIVDYGDMKIYALNRTGALPVSYIPGGAEDASPDSRAYRAEETAYDFFASLSNPTLVRVVQYGALYQIFINLGDKTVGDGKASIKEVTPPMRDATRRLVDYIRNYEKKHDEVIGALIDSVGKVDSAVSLKGYEAYLAGGRDLPSNAYKCIKSVDDYLKTLGEMVMSSRDDETFFSSLESYLLDRRNNSLSWTPENPMRLRIRSVFDDVADDKRGQLVVFKKYLDLTWRDYKLMLSFFVPDVQTSVYKDGLVMYHKNSRATWMKTPTVVESWRSSDSVNCIGGHNLDADVTVFRVNNEQKAGAPRLHKTLGKQIVDIAVADVAGGVLSPDYLRRVGRLGDAHIGTADRKTARRRSDVISDRKRTVRGLDPAAHMSYRFNGNDFERDGHAVSLTDLFDEIGRSLAEGDGSPVKEIVIENYDAAGVNVRAIIDGVAYRMPRGDGTDIPLVRYDLNHYTTEISGDKAIVRIPIRAGRFLRDGRTGVEVKDGEAVFEMHKSLLQRFIAMIKKYVQTQRGRWNQFRLRREMRRRGISPTDVRETTRLRFALLLTDHYTEIYA